MFAAKSLCMTQLLPSNLALAEITLVYTIVVDHIVSRNELGIVAADASIFLEQHLSALTENHDR